MDVKTIMAGIRPLLPDETANRVRVLGAAHARVAAGGSGSIETFVAALPQELVGLHFGSGGFDDTIVRSFATVHQAAPIVDVVKIAILNQLVMELTYQGRHLVGKWQPPEAAVFIGSTTPDVACAMMNGTWVLGLRLDAGPADDLAFDAIVAAAAALDVQIGPAKHRAMADLSSHLEGHNRDLGLVVLDGLDGLSSLRSVVEAVGPRCGPATFFAICDEAHRIARFAAQMAQHHPEALLSIRYNRLVDRPAEYRGILIVTGMTGAWSPLLDNATQRAVTFVAALDPQTPAATQWRIGSKIFGQVFRGSQPEHPAYELVTLKPPLVLRSSAPLPVYSRDQIEKPMLVPQRIATVKGGGVVYSRSPEHATYFYVSPEGELLSDIFEQGSFYRSPMYRTAVRDQERLVSSTIDLRRVRKIKGAAIPLCFSPNAHDFHSHFLLQCFPRVLIARELYKDATLLVPHDLKRYQKEMLHHVGFTEDRLFPIEPSTVVYCDELFVPELWPAIFTAYNSLIYDELIEKIVPHAGKPHRRIMISRAARQTWRNMVNFNAVSQVLEDEFGFEVVTPDKLSLRDEIELFRESRIIAGAEGAGLYNCCFLDRESAVLDFADQDYVMYIIASMAQIRGFDVGYVFGESFQADTDLAHRGGHTDFVIDPALVRSGAKELLEKLAN